MKRHIVTSTDSYKTYWAYNEIKRNWPVDIKKTQTGDAIITIWYDKSAKDIYAKFLIEQVEYADSDLGLAVYVVDGTDKYSINEELEAIDTLDDAIKSCLYYFHSRF